MKHVPKKPSLYLAILFLCAAAVLFVMIRIDTGKPGNESAVKPSNGVVNLSAWDPETQGLLDLSGEWSFYWEKLLTYGELDGAKPDLTVSVPSVWSGYDVGGRKLPGFGYATYTLRVENLPSDAPLALRFANAGTAYRLYADGTLIASNGEVGMSVQSSRPAYKLEKLQFQPPGRDFTLILQISNFDYCKGGMWYPLILGTPEAVQDYSENIAYRDLFLLGAFCVLALYYLTIFLMKRDYRGSLYFVLLCLIATVRTLISGDYVIFKLFPFVGFQAVSVIDYLSLSWVPAGFFLLYQNLLPGKGPPWRMRVLAGFGCAMSLFIFCTPVSVFSGAGWLVEGVIFITVLYSIAGAGRKLGKYPADASVLLLGGAAMLFAVVHDTLMNNNLIESRFGDMSATGFLILIVLSAFLLAKNLKESYDREMRAELKFLQSQIRPHFLHNALNTIISVSRRDGDEARRLLVEFSKYLRHCFDFENLDELVPLEQELEFVRSYTNIERARFGDRLKIDYDIDDMTLRVPPLILQPLVENAVIHGLREKPEGGSILVYAKKGAGGVTLGVRDSGIGIPEAVQKALADVAEGEPGVALGNISRRLKRLYGASLRIESAEGQGTDVSMVIPFRGGKKDAESLSDR